MAQSKEFQRYRIKEKLRSVASYMDVYLAEQQGLERAVELRILSRPVKEDSAEYRRFRRELRLLATLDHPCIIQVLDLGCHANRLFYTTPYRNAKSVEELLVETGIPFGERETIELALQIGDALRYMHENTLLHRNISTKTVFYDLDNLRPYIADFVTLKASSEGGLSKSEIPFVYDSFFTPEQIFDQRLDERTDLYLLGAALYRLLTLQNPFEKKDLLRSNLESAFSIEAPSKFNSKISSELEAIVMKLLEQAAENRYQGAEELLSALDDSKYSLKEKRQ